METGIRYSEGSQYSDPKVKAEIRIQILTNDGLLADDYRQLIVAIADIQAIVEKYKEQN